jgi:hypothetical protein
LESVKYRIGDILFENGDLPAAEKEWSHLGKGTIWAKMAQEKIDGAKWKDQYKKYINRIPAMSGFEKE